MGVLLKETRSSLPVVHESTIVLSSLNNPQPSLFSVIGRLRLGTLNQESFRLPVQE